MPGLNLHFLSEADCRGWTAIDDRVMGGVSRSAVEWSGGKTGIFAGVVSMENDGGFASVRVMTPGVTLTDAVAIRLRVRGDGKRYKVSLRDDESFDGVLFQQSFDTRPGCWETVDLPVSGFRPTFRGKPVDAVWDTGRIAAVGLMISERQAGPFRLEIESIESC